MYCTLSIILSLLKGNQTKTFVPNSCIFKCLDLSENVTIKKGKEFRVSTKKSEAALHSALNEPAGK